MYWFWFIGWNRFAPWAFHCTGQKCYGQETWRQLKNQEKLHWFCLGSAWLLICLGKEQALLPVAKCSNAEKYVSCGYSGDFGGDKHFFLRKISIDATHWNWKNCFYFLFSLKNQICFSFLSQLLQLPWFLAQMMGVTHVHWNLKESSFLFFLCEPLEVMILANPNWIIYSEGNLSGRSVHGWKPQWVEVIESVVQGYQCKWHTLGNLKLPSPGCF